MRRLLSHPLAFFLLPLCVINWTILIALHPCARPLLFFETDARHCPPIDLVEYDIDLPLFEFFHRLYRSRPQNRHIQAFCSSGGGVANLGPAIIVRSGSKLFLLPRQLALENDLHIHDGDIDAAAIVSGTRRVETFGLLMPCATRYTTHLESHAIPGHTILATNELSGIVHSSLQTGRFAVFKGTQTRWKIHLVAILHDTGFLLLVCSWFVSLSAVPSWQLWSRLEPSPKKHDITRCPKCYYPTTGLTTPTCPECGNQIRSEPVF